MIFDDTWLHHSLLMLMLLCEAELDFAFSLTLLDFVVYASMIDDGMKWVGGLVGQRHFLEAWLLLAV